MPSENGTMMQFFQWYDPYDGRLWKEIATQATSLAQAGFTAIWIPPAYKGSGGGYDVGYGVYDLFDLGEFDQKNTTSTKYGSRQDLLSALQAARNAHLQVYADVVFNHKDGGDETEYVDAQEVDWNSRNWVRGGWHQVQIWSHFYFPGRQGKYSTYEWHWWHFDAVSYDHNHPDMDSRVLYRLRDKQFSTEVSHEHGNSDYLSACDIDTSIADGELRYWGRWFVDTTHVDGFRLDAVKHIRASFFRDWLNHLRVHYGGRELFTVGEYWSRDVEELHSYITVTQGVMSLFDVPLHYRFRDASISGNAYDMRTIFDRTLVKEQPTKAVTFVDNHDTQPCCSLESWVEPWFKPMAYALILLRRDGYPCVFYGDYFDQPRYSDKGREVTLYSHKYLIDKFVQARRDYGFGDQHDYFDHPNTVGWIRLGTTQHPGAMAVVLTNGSAGNKWMNTFRPNAVFKDCTGHIASTVTADANGWANFLCPAGSVSVWLQQ